MQFVSYFAFVTCVVLLGLVDLCLLRKYFGVIVLVYFDLMVCTTINSL